MPQRIVTSELVIYNLQEIKHKKADRLHTVLDRDKHQFLFRLEAGRLIQGQRKNDLSKPGSKQSPPFTLIITIIIEVE